MRPDFSRGQIFKHYFITVIKIEESDPHTGDDAYSLEQTSSSLHTDLNDGGNCSVV